MKIQVGFKTPDALDCALETVEHESDEEFSKAEAVLRKYIRYAECITVEFDTETGEAKVLPLNL